MTVKFIMRLAAQLEDGLPLRSRFATVNRTPDGAFAVLDLATDEARVIPDSWTAASIWDLLTRAGITRDGLKNG